MPEDELGGHEAETLFRLLPPGRIWPSHPESRFRQLLHALAVPFAIVRERARSLLDELDPRTTVELLPEWERTYGLPEPCTPPGLTLQERRIELVRKVVWRAESRVQSYLDLAALLGYEDVTFDENVPNPFEVTVHVPGARVTFSRAGASRCGDRFAEIERADDLECLLGEVNPAHVRFIVSYEGV